MTLSAAGGLSLGSTSDAGAGNFYATGEVDWGGTGPGASSLGFLSYTGGNSAIGSRGATALTLYTNGSERMRIDSSGNVGIGTSSPGVKLQVDGGSTSGTIGQFGNAQGGVILGAASSVAYVNTTSSSPLAFQINGTERARIDTSGNLLVGTTTQYGVLTTAADLASKNTAAFQNTGTTYSAGAFFVRFVNSSAATAGSIQHTAVTTVNYSTSSDQRLKIDKGVATSTEVIDNTIIHDFEWKADGRIDRGVFAQEAHLVKPSAVSVGSDELTKDGNLENPWGVDYSKYVPDLIVYVKQLKSELDSVKAELATLKG